ncbi:MAG: Stage II sporulation protein required for processing of pro-sigma-E (SpoIIR) [Firmicutes bacterium]|nr:Stage II sporulation protein required for processing of pro-sigma-E (SpoIIR) [Bacillota bacterium]
MKRAGIIILVFLVITAGLYIGRVTYQQDLMVDNLLRLHVIANSDSPRDQALKNDVRDRLVKEIGDRVAGMESKQEVLDFLRDNMELIETVASDEVAAHNASYGVKAETGRFEFPTKLYGNLALPAGKYDALRVFIGDGNGANWWCVMFPPLCFVDTKNAVAFAKDQERVRDMLTEEEFEILMSSQNMDEVPVKVRFKIIELINMSKIKLAHVFGR